MSNYLTIGERSRKKRVTRFDTKSKFFKAFMFDVEKSFKNKYDRYLKLNFNKIKSCCAQLRTSEKTKMNDLKIKSTYIIKLQLKV